MEGGRKWEDLGEDCLVNVFGRLGFESLIMDVPFVCKSWYTATLNPLCWKTLKFSGLFINRTRIPKLNDPLKFDPLDDDTNYPIFAFVKYAVNRSHGCAELIELPWETYEELVQYIADNLVCKWKHLEFLTLGIGSQYKLPEVLTQIKTHCNNFIGLSIKSVVLNDKAALCIVALPNIKYLCMSWGFFRYHTLVTILQGCKQLVELDVRHCTGFDADDNHILNLASHITKFMCEGSESGISVLRMMARMF